uniref:Uncharacterized protein n=1 Tax=Romanomermis culicivorax TaxID=13658 RepID=A0A915IN77_ROMCU
NNPAKKTTSSSDVVRYEYSGVISLDISTLARFEEIIYVIQQFRQQWLIHIQQACSNRIVHGACTKATLPQQDIADATCNMGIAETSVNTERRLMLYYAQAYSAANISWYAWHVRFV